MYWVKCRPSHTVYKEFLFSQDSKYYWHFWVSNKRWEQKQKTLSYFVSGKKHCLPGERSRHVSQHNSYTSAQLIQNAVKLLTSVNRQYLHLQIIIGPNFRRFYRWHNLVVYVFTYNFTTKKKVIKNYFK